MTTDDAYTADDRYPDRFRGDWMPDELGDYAGRLSYRWSGGVVFKCDRATAERIVTDQARLIVGEDDDRLRWDGDALVHESPMWETTDRYEPDDDGAYSIGFGWTWSQTDAREPTAEQRAAWRELQTAVRAEGFEVTGLERREEPDGADSFPIYRLDDNGEKTAGGVRVLQRVEIDRAYIHPDGSITRRGNADH